MNNYRRGEFADFATETSRPTALQTGVAYRSVGVKWYGEGVHVYETRQGHEFNADRFEIRAGDLIYNDMWARMGSVAIVPPELSGAVASSHFPTFQLNREIIEPRYLHWFFKTPGFWDECEAASRGSTGRNQIKRRTFLAIQVPLPPLPEQRRIVARIEELAAQIHEARTLRHQADEETENLLASRRMHLFDEAAQANRGQTRLGDVCKFQGGSQPPKLQFAYESRDGFVRLIQIRDFKSNDYLTFVPKDSVRKFCTADDVMIGRYGPPIFQILRGIEGAYNVALMKATPDESCLSKDFLFHLLQEPRLFQKVEEDSQRSSGQTGIRRELLEDHITFVPPLAEQRHIVAELDALQSQVDALAGLQSETAAELDALLPAILDRAFKGIL